MNSDKIKKISFFTAGLLVIISFSAFLVNKNLHDPKLIAPVIKFTEEKKDLGDVKQGPQITGEFEFENVGKNPLEIISVQASCGCTGVIMDDKKVFGPGEKGKIKFTFNTEGRSGKQEKQITVTSNDPKTPTKVVSFICNIIL